MLISHFLSQWLGLICLVCLNFCWLFICLICLISCDWWNIWGCYRLNIRGSCLISRLRFKCLCIVFTTKSYFCYWWWMINISYSLVVCTYWATNLNCGIINSRCVRLIGTIDDFSLWFICLITIRCCRAINCNWSSSICRIWGWNTISRYIAKIISAI